LHCSARSVPQDSLLPSPTSRAITARKACRAVWVKAAMGGMKGTMQGCPMMSGGGMGHAMPHLPPGNEKLELQMHADMMRAMADVLGKYVARLPDKK